MYKQFAHYIGESRMRPFHTVFKMRKTFRLTLRVLLSDYVNVLHFNSMTPKDFFSLWENDASFSVEYFDSNKPGSSIIIFNGKSVSLCNLIHLDKVGCDSSEDDRLLYEYIMPNEKQEQKRKKRRTKNKKPFAKVMEVSSNSETETDRDEEQPEFDSPHHS
jgi:hypothetical protein